MPSILFVCLGNICRSPTAEGVFRHLLAENGLTESVHVDSAGTGSWHVGEPADPRMRAAAARRGYDLASIARQVETEDFQRFDLIVAMDRTNLRDLQSAAPPGADLERVRLFSSFLDPDQEWPEDVPDPYYGGDAGFERVLDMIEAAAPRLLEELRRR